MTKEQLVAQIIEQCKKDGEPVTLEEATEMAEMEIKANSNRRYEKSEKKKKSPTRERKVDKTKLEMLSCTRVLMEGLGAVTIAVKNESELTFSYEGNKYTFKLIRHRK